VKAGLYPEFKYGISDYVLRDSRAPFNMRDQKGGDGPGWLHLSFRPSHVKKHSTLIADAVAWHKAGRPSPVTFVKRLRNPKGATVAVGSWQRRLEWLYKSAPIFIRRDKEHDERIAALTKSVELLMARVEAVEKERVA
jgi:hypothetical protein